MRVRRHVGIDGSVTRIVRNRPRADYWTNSIDRVSKEDIDDSLNAEFVITGSRSGFAEKRESFLQYKGNYRSRISRHLKGKVSTRLKQRSDSLRKLWVALCLKYWGKAYQGGSYLKDGLSWSGMELTHGPDSRFAL